MRKKISIILVLALVFIFTACNTNSNQSDLSTTGSAAISADTSAVPNDGTVHKMRIGAISSPPTPEAEFIIQLESYIEEATNGRIDVEAYHSGTLGTTTQMIQGLQDGSVEGVCVPVNYYESYVPELGVLGLPMFFDSAEQAYKFCSTAGNGFHEMLAELLESKGFVIGCWGISANSIFVSNKPIQNMSNFKSLKVWCLPNARIVDGLSALGAAPVNFDTGDLAVGIQNKTVDAAYTGAQLLGAQKLQETAKNLFIPTVPMNFNVQSLMLSKVFVDSLPDDLKAILLETLEKAGTEIHYPMATAQIEKSLQTMIDADGMSVVYSDDAFTQQAKEAFRPLADKFLTDTPSAKPLYDLATELIANDQ